MIAIYLNELKIYLHSMITYVFCAFVLLFTGLYVMIYNLNIGVTNFEYVLREMSYVFIIIVPLLTMRIIAEDRKQKTDQLIYSLPLTMADVAIGKYLALLTVFVIPVLVIAVYPLILANYGDVYLPQAYSAIGGFFLLGATLIAIGEFISSICESQAVAAGLCFVIMLINYFIETIVGYLPTTAFSSFACISVVILLISFIVDHFLKNDFITGGFFGLLEGSNVLCFFLLSEKYEGLFADIVSQLSLFSRFEVFTDGIFDLTGVTYFICFAVFFVFITIQSLEKRRWE